MKRLVAAMALSFLLTAPVTSEALSLEADVLYTPSIGSPNGCLICFDVPSSITIQNNSDAGGTITQMVIDLSTAASDASYSGALSPISGASATGYTGYYISGDRLTLNFTSFDPGDVFLFSIDVDDNDRTVTASEFAGTALNVTFNGSTTLAGTYDSYLGGVVGGGTVTTRIPEPATLLLVAGGLIGIGWAGRKRWAEGIDR